MERLSEKQLNQMLSEIEQGVKPREAVDDDDELLLILQELVEYRAEIQRLKSPAAVVEAYHALNKKLLGPWEKTETLSGQRWDRRQSDKHVAEIYKPAEKNRFGAVFDGVFLGGFDSLDQAMDACDSIARERGYTLIGGL